MLDPESLIHYSMKNASFKVKQVVWVVTYRSTLLSEVEGGKER